MPQVVEATANTQHRSRALFNHAQRLERHRTGRCVMHLRLSPLLREGLSRQHARIALAVCENGLHGLEGEVFPLNEADLVFVGLTRERNDIAKAAEKVQYLLQGDPLFELVDGDHTLAMWFDLDHDYERFMDYLREQIAAEQRSHSARATAAASNAAKRPLKAADLAGVERALISADISALVHQQWVCKIGTDGLPKRVIAEYFTSMRDIEATLAPDVDLASNRSLFQYLTQILDIRMLSLLRQEARWRLQQTLSINLNVASLLSPAFLDFDRDLPRAMRGRVMVELQIGDVLSDLKSFQFARDFLREQNYRLCLDGLTVEVLPLIDRQRLGFDFVKLIWNHDLETRLSSAPLDVGKELQRLGPSHIILHRCEHDRQVTTAGRLGIELFQGHYIDGLLAATGEAAYPAAAVD